MAETLEPDHGHTRAGRLPRLPGQAGPPAAAAVNGATRPHRRDARRPPEQAHQGSRWLASAHQLLAHACQSIEAADDESAAPHRLGQLYRARLAAWLAEITGWAELAISPGNLPTSPSPSLTAGDRGDLSGRMQRATDQLHQARMLLERLAAADRPQSAAPAGGPVLGRVTDAARHAEHAWMLIQRTRGYTHRDQVDEVAAGLTDLTRVLGRLARYLDDAGRPDTQQQHAPPSPPEAGSGGSWWDVVVQLAHAHYAVMGCTTAAPTIPGRQPPAPPTPEEPPPGARASIHQQPHKNRADRA
jgi:hypothetical protein